MASQERTQPNRMHRAGGRVGRGVVIGLIYAYQGVASVFPKVCRFEPSCSNYGLEAVRVHGALTGGWLTLKRILRCRPGGGFGVDPVPPRGCAHDHAPASRAPGDPTPERGGAGPDRAVGPGRAGRRERAAHGERAPG